MTDDTRSPGTARRPLRRARLDIALDTRTVTALLRIGRTTHRAEAPFALPAQPDDARPVIAAALMAVRDRLDAVVGRPTGRVRARLALLPPLVDARLVPLPPLRHAEAEAVLRRDAARHFVGGASPRAVAVARARQSGAPVFAAAAPTVLVDAVHSAAVDVGLTVDAVVPAHSAWIAASRSTRTGAHAVVAATGDVVHVHSLEDGRLTSLRQLPRAETHEAIAAVGPGPGSVTLFVPAEARSGLERAFAAAGWTVEPDGSALTAAEAAVGGARAADMELTTPAVAAERQARARKRARWVAVAAAVLVLSAAGVELWGTQRELDAVLERRAAIRADVEPLLALRDSLSALEARVDVIQSVAAIAPRWTSALLDLALLLPEDSHITTLHATGDTLFVEAAGARAGAALQALRDASSLRDVRIDGIVERDLEAGATAEERFRLRARLAPPVPSQEPASTMTAATSPTRRSP